ncbi:MAG: hypothetical protein K8F59_17420 [Rhodobacteraceae bacterium]|nr:hypothetical protein [Paracoccaceae bacterium]
MLVAWGFLALAAAAETRLVMFDADGCSWCLKWHREIGGVYPLTEEGRRAPLVVLDISDPVPADMQFSHRPRYTPTFVLIEDGVEIARIEGYPGEDFFWGLLEMMLQQAVAGQG